MQLFLNTNDCPTDAWVEEFLRTTVVFAVWNHREPIRRIRVDLSRPGGKADGTVHCRIEAATERRVVAAESLDRDLSEAIQTAADRLEVALWHEPGRPPSRLEERPFALQAA